MTWAISTKHPQILHPLPFFPFCFSKTQLLTKQGVLSSPVVLELATRVLIFFLFPRFSFEADGTDESLSELTILPRRLFPP